jgi:hypothetical protein
VEPLQEVEGVDGGEGVEEVVTDSAVSFSHIMRLLDLIYQANMQVEKICT